MSGTHIFIIVWCALAISWGVFLVVRREWMSALARELKQHNGMRIAFGSQSPRWMVSGGVAFIVVGAALIVFLVSR